MGEKIIDREIERIRNWTKETEERNDRRKKWEIESKERQTKEEKKERTVRK